MTERCCSISAHPWLILHHSLATLTHFLFLVFPQSSQPQDLCIGYLLRFFSLPYGGLVTQLCLTLCNPADCSPPARLPCPWDSPGNTGVTCHFFLQGNFPTQQSNPSLLYCRQSPASQIFYPLGHQASFFSLFTYLIHFSPRANHHPISPSTLHFRLRPLC